MRRTNTPKCALRDLYVRIKDRLRQDELESEWVLGSYIICVSANQPGRLDSDLLAWLRFALLPVGCGVSFFASTPNLTGGAGPVFCGCNGAMVGCRGIGGMGGTGGA